MKITITNEMQAADKFWGEAMERVVQVLHEMGFIHEDEIEAIVRKDWSFIYEVFDYGDYIPADGEIAEAIDEYVEGN